MLFHSILYIYSMKNTGIYKIESLSTGRNYIGSAIIISRRWNRHKRDLINNKHHSSFLQRHFNKYGLNDLQFNVLEYCSAENLLIREQYYLDSEKCEFNNAKVAGSCYGTKRSNEFKQKTSELTSGKNNPTYGLERTKEWRDKISKANKGQVAWNKNQKQIYSKETLLKMSVSAKNRNTKKCLHCNYSLSLGNYKRWHGDNCSYKNVEKGFKTCSKCKTIKSLSYFNSSKIKHDNKESICKDCKSQINKERYAKKSQ